MNLSLETLFHAMQTAWFEHANEDAIGPALRPYTRLSHLRFRIHTDDAGQFPELVQALKDSPRTNFCWQHMHKGEQIAFFRLNPPFTQTGRERCGWLEIRAPREDTPTGIDALVYAQPVRSKTEEEPIAGYPGIVRRYQRFSADKIITGQSTRR